MQQFWKKIERNIGIIKKEWMQDIREYSIQLAIFRLLSTLFQILKLKTVSEFFKNKKNNIILSYLNKKYGFIFLKYKDQKCLKYSSEEDTSQLPIWVCWLEGIEKAPELVKRCVESIYVHANGHSVILLSWDNISKYIDIPFFLKSKLDNKMMSPAHFSDVLRIMLLNKYGGLWLDSTIFCNKNIPEKYFKRSFFSCKSNQPTPGCVSNNRWTTFCIGGHRGNVIFRVLEEFFLNYWKNETHAIDYLFFDDAIELAYSLLPYFEEEIDQLPINNILRDELILHFADPWDKEMINDLLESDTVLFKLGYRENIFLKQMDRYGNQTVYSAFIRRLF